ncbi:proteasome assembly chaperone family protein [Candidatus Micrarchaeota archaeon CG10_big_fil_rev_8_21_14_0_10_45_29]|nr:MAG: proteasome assembly chaperone family protein [Candidatus Micrarchaeota archaeon CG10_big_fil_rev_8_21_14_0_10_45_29]
MQKTIIRVKKGVKIKSPVLVEGLPGIGLVGKIAADYLVKSMNAKKIANIYSPYFPPQVLMRKNGVARMLGMRLYHIPQKKNDILVLAGDVQPSLPEAHFEVCGKILNYFKKKKGKMIITLGGYGSGKAAPNPKVYGAANNKKLAEKFSKAGIEFGKTKGAIVGAAGLLLGLAKFEKIDAACLMGETHGAYVDPKSSLVVLKALERAIGIKIDTAKLEKEIKEGEKFAKKIEEQMAKAGGEQAHAGIKDLSYIR